MVIVALLLLSIACGASAAPTPVSTVTPPPAIEPTATPLPTPTTVPTVTQTTEVERDSTLEGDDRDISALDAVFPEISEKMKDIRPVYTAYFHSEDGQATGENTTVNEVFKLLKMENIVTHEGNQQVSPAMIVDQEPDLIIAESIESVVENPDLAGLHMTKDTLHIPHHIFVMKEGYSFYVADPGFRDTVAAFAAFAYPDTFPMEEAAVDDHGESGKGHEGGTEEADQEMGGQGHDDGQPHGH